MEDKFFEKENCDRCGNSLKIRIMSWFTDDVICPNCSEKESVVRRHLPDGGRDFEGCGYLPKITKEEVQNENS